MSLHYLVKLEMFIVHTTELIKKETIEFIYLLFLNYLLFLPILE